VVPKAVGSSPIARPIKNCYTYMMNIKSFVALLASGLILLTLIPAIAGAARTSGTTTRTPLGIDISWPQCGKRVPTDQAFGIVGVNGGLATTTNPCLREQLIWAKRSNGGTSQELVQLYVNTANPGGLNTESWPKSNTDPAGIVTDNPHGICDNSDSLACAWQYGWNRALEDVRDRFQPAAARAGISSVAATYIWWLDVETENTWKLSGTAFDHQSNVAVLEGMTAHFSATGARVGLYSTGAQWNQIVGGAVGTDSNLNGLPNWRPGGANLTTSKEACKAAPLTANGGVVLTQFISKNLDYNYSCV
jgi:hypothetical protein